MKFVSKCRRHIIVRSNQGDYKFTRRHTGKYVLLNTSSRGTFDCLYIQIPPRQCLICCSKQADVTLPCNHEVCKECLFATILNTKKRCPFCRSSIGIPNALKTEYYSALEAKFSLLRNQLVEKDNMIQYLSERQSQFNRLIQSWNELYCIFQESNSSEEFKNRFMDLDTYLVQTVPALYHQYQQTRKVWW